MLSNKTSINLSTSGLAVTIFLCFGLFQAQSIFLAILSLAILSLAAALRLPSAITRFRLPVLIICVYVVFVLLNLALHGSLGDILSAHFFRHDGKLLPTLAVFVGATLYYDGDRKSSPFWTAAFGIILCAAALLPAMIFFGASSHGLLTGFFTSHNALAGATGSLLLVIALVQNRVRQISPFLWVAIGIVASMSAYLFIMAGSRAFMVGLAAAMTYLVWSTNLSFLKKGTAICLVLLMLVATVIVSPVADRISYDYLKDDQNMLTRILFWQRAIQHVQDSPIVGVGIGSFNDSSVVLENVAPGISVKSSSEKFFGENHAHNIILHVLAEQGLLGLALLSWFWLSLLRRKPCSYIQFRPNELEDFKLMKRTITAIFIYLLAASMLGNNLLTMSTAFIFYILAAAFVSSTVRKSKNNKRLVAGHQLASM